MADEVAWHSLFFREDTVLQTTASVELAEFPVSEGKGYFIPQKRLWEELCRMMGFPESVLEKVRSIRSYRLKVTLDLDHYDIDPEADAYFDPEEHEIQKDRSLLLRDVFEKRDSCVYSYDFGDDWEHVITVEERFDTGSGKFKLLEMQGERPPEDVGGEGGFEDYMRVLSNPDDPEYESTVRWAEGTKAKPESMEAINKKLGWLI